MPPGEAPVTDIAGSQGLQVGDGNVQYNTFNFLFGGGRPDGPVVAGNVPQAPSAFQPREDLMSPLRVAGPGVPVVRALTGMRGVGKTQLAAAYARECIDTGWRLVAWVSAQDSPAILNGLAVVAARIGLARPETALEIVGGEVRNRLEADGDRCLLVFDNVTDPAELRPYLPAAGRAQVVITSTGINPAGLDRPTPVDVFTVDESAGFLAGRTRLDDRAGAAELADELGHLPLALAQAAAVIATQRLTYPVYLGRLRAYPAARYLPPDKGDPYPRGVAEAIALSIDAVAVTDPAGLCTDLLNLISFLSPQGVARDLLYLGVPSGVYAAAPARAQTAPGNQTGAKTPPVDAAAIDEAIGRLADASLVTFGGNQTVIAHRLTMRAVRERAEDAGGGFVLAAKACMLLDTARAAQDEPRLNRAEVRVFAEHVVAMSGNVASSPSCTAPGGADSAALTGSLALRVLNLRAWALTFLNLAGDAVTQAVGIAERLLADCEAALGESHPGALSVRNNLGYAYRAAGRLDDAITQYQRALVDHERLAGPMHPETLTCRNNLGAAYDAAGRGAQAVELLERTLTDRELLLGPDHPETLTSRNNLAGAYATAGRLSEAVSQQERVLADRERVLGADHPDTLRSRTNLASVLAATGGPRRALPLYEQVVADYERKLGDEHPDTLIARCNLARCNYGAGRLPRAVQQYQRALAGLERALGPDHPTTVSARTGLGAARQQAASDTTRGEQ